MEDVTEAASNQYDSVRSVGDSAWFLILAHSYGCTSDALGCWRQKGTAPREQRSGVARR